MAIIEHVGTDRDRYLRGPSQTRYAFVAGGEYGARRIAEVEDPTDAAWFLGQKESDGTERFVIPSDLVAAAEARNFLSMVNHCPEAVLGAIAPMVESYLSERFEKLEAAVFASGTGTDTEDESDEPAKKRGRPPGSKNRG